MGFHGNFSVLCLFQYRQFVGQSAVDHRLRQYCGQQLPFARLGRSDLGHSGAVAYAALGSQADAIKILMRERQVELCGAGKWIPSTAFLFP